MSAARAHCARATVPNVTAAETPTLDRQRASRWSAPLSALGSLVILGCADLVYSLGQRTFLRAYPSENPTVAEWRRMASHHASGVADGVLLFATMLVVSGGVLGAVRPRRGLATAILTVSVLALVAIQVAIRADIHTLNLYLH